MMHHQIFNQIFYLVITKLNEKITKSFIGTITKFNGFITINLYKIQGRSKAVATEAVAKGAIFLGAQKGINLSQNN